MEVMERSAVRYASCSPAWSLPRSEVDSKADRRVRQALGDVALPEARGENAAEAGHMGLARLVLAGTGECGPILCWQMLAVLAVRSDGFHDDCQPFLACAAKSVRFGPA